MNTKLKSNSDFCVHCERFYDYNGRHIPHVCSVWALEEVLVYNWPKLVGGQNDLLVRIFIAEASYRFEKSQKA